LDLILDSERRRLLDSAAVLASDAHALVSTSLDELVPRARAARLRRNGDVVTFSPKVFIPLTHLCRDVCHYCVFAHPPAPGAQPYLRPEQVLALARAGAAAGCHEALFTLGDKPERRYRIAREALAQLRVDSTVEYLARMCELVLSETGLLPHVNAGVMTRAEIERLRAVSASQGLTLESHPAARLETIALAGELAVPFTTGLLIGIGETRAERIDALLAIAATHERHGHIQEVIVQNFRAKPGTKMAEHPEPGLEELLWTIAAARLVLPPGISLQCPPNLSYESFPRLLDGGIDDWGGVSPVTRDHVNPEAPWPQRERLARATATRGLVLAERLAVHPPFISERWLDPAVLPYVLRRADAHGLAREDGWHAGSTQPIPALARRAGTQLGQVGDVLARSRSGEELDEDDVTALFGARGSALAAVLAAADALRREVCGDAVTYVVTRNINYTNVCYFRCGFCAFSKGKLARNLRGAPYVVPIEEIVRRAREAWDRGAVEVCLQGGIHPGFTGDFYLDVCRALRAEVPGLHVHAFSALEVYQGAATLDLPLDEYLSRLRDAGLASLPGTAAEVLDDAVREVICPDKLTTAQWLEVHDRAHAAGLRSTTTVMFGHVDGPRAWARHLLALRDQQKRSGGFTELVPLPFVHMEAPIFLRGRARPGPTFREAILMHAVGRLSLHPWITNVQASWVKLGLDGARVALRAGANDLGGTLMNESISRAAGAAHGQEASPERLEAMIRATGRIPRQRSTFYGEPPPEQVRRSFGAVPVSAVVERPAREAGLVAPRRLVRPGALGRSYDLAAASDRMPP
jgi:FO synthase